MEDARSTYFDEFAYFGDVGFYTGFLLQLDKISTAPGRETHLFKLQEFVFPVVIVQSAAQEDDLGSDDVCAGQVVLFPAVGIHCSRRVLCAVRSTNFVQRSTKLRLRTVLLSGDGRLHGSLWTTESGGDRDGRWEHGPAGKGDAGCCVEGGACKGTQSGARENATGAVDCCCCCVESLCLASDCVVSFFAWISSKCQIKPRPANGPLHAYIQLGNASASDWLDPWVLAWQRSLDRLCGISIASERICLHGPTGCTQTPTHRLTQTCAPPTHQPLRGQALGRPISAALGRYMRAGDSLPPSVPLSFSNCFWVRPTHRFMHNHPSERPLTVA